MKKSDCQGNESPKLSVHFFTDAASPFSFDYVIPGIEDRAPDFDIQEFLQDEGNDCREALREIIEDLFKTPALGMFDMAEIEDSFYRHYEECLRHIHIEFIGQTNTHCQLTPEMIGDFGNDNGDIVGSCLSLEILRNFLCSGSWHIGYFDKTNQLIADCRPGEINPDDKSIKPVVWFGQKDEIIDCWKIDSETEDSFVSDFWDDFHYGALYYIVKGELAERMLDYSIDEYGLDVPEDEFEMVKSSCPIDLSLPFEQRLEALKKLFSEKGITAQSVPHF